ncbi:MAG: transporter permease [Massilia sp.]|nr:transporter permease [Massilia sp.]
MLRHLLKLIWKRKSRNLMLSLEILLAFVIVFGVAAFGARCYQLYRMPIGFQYQHVWSARILGDSDKAGANMAQTYETFKRSLGELPEVEQVGFAGFSPFRSATMSTTLIRPGSGRKLDVNVVEVSDDFFALAGVTLARGRGFSSVDEGAAGTPVVVNRRMADTLFPGEDPLGKAFTDTTADMKNITSYKVVGLVEEFRNQGELMSPVSLMLARLTPPSKNHERHHLRTIMLKVKPGVGREFEQKLNTRLKAINNEWSYEISPLADMRKSMLTEKTIPLIILSIITGFMLVMVAFGLFGVLWQNTTRRIPEIGLRRAVGASSAQIYGQIIGEQLLLSSVAMAVALALLVQLPVTGALGERLNWTVFGAAAALSMGVIYLTSLLCSLYPGWRASRLSPTEALHYE